MANEVRYIRNRRPNMFKIKLYARTPNQVVFPLERRGHPSDCIAVPGDAFNDHGFLKNLRTGAIEEITQETFMALALRVDQNPPQAQLVERVRHGIASDFDPEVHIKTGHRWEVEGETMFNAYEVPEFEKLSRETELMKPRLEFAAISDSEEDAQQALREAGMLVEEEELVEEEVAPTPVAKKPAAKKKGPLKYDEITRKNSPRKKTTKGVVGGNTIEAMEDE